MLTLRPIYLAKDMSNEKNNKIEDYLDGKLSNKELKEFEKTLQDDAQLAKKVKVTKEVNQTIAQETQLKAFKAQLNQLNENYFSAENAIQEPTTIVKPLRSNNLRRSLIAASVLVLAVSAFFAWSVLNSSMSSAELFATHYEPYGIGQRGNNANGSELEQQATLAYNNNDFEKAIPLFEEITQSDDNNEKNILRLGSAYLSTNQPQKAIDTFQKIISNPQSALMQTAQWYQALAYIQLEQTEEAKNILNKLANAGNRTYPSKAKKLLKYLD